MQFEINNRMLVFVVFFLTAVCTSQIIFILMKEAGKLDWAWGYILLPCAIPCMVLIIIVLASTLCDLWNRFR